MNEKHWRFGKPELTESIIIPRRVTIETIGGICNLRCPMCPISMPKPSKVSRGIMPTALFERIIDALRPYKKKIEMMDLFGLGEPFLDPFIYARVKYAKSAGFRNIGFSTNAAVMTESKQLKILESGIDTIIFSIDGATKEIYEGIRVGSNFEKTISLCLEMIERRNKGNYQTRFLVRFIRQRTNRHEWETFKRFWEEKIDRKKRDFLGVYDAHSWQDFEVEIKRDEQTEREACPVPFEVLYVLSDGTVTYCSEDWGEGRYNFGNVKDTDPIEIFNSPRFKSIRQLHIQGQKNKLPLCRHCTIPYSEKTKEYI